MKLLLDQNLSPHLANRLDDLFPGTLHVRDIGLQAADDNVVWRFAMDNGFCITSKDADFHQISFLNVRIKAKIKGSESLKEIA